MTPFLKLVTDDLYSRLKGNFERVTIVFPNKRAGLFFNEYLLEKIEEKAIWSPAYLTINELFEQCSEYVVGDPVLLVSRLHKIYNECTGSNESLDNFYYWGEMLVKDFDDVDKNMANAKQLFANIKELHDLGTAKDTLSEEQRKSIQRFFVNFDADKSTDIKTKFTAVWNVLHDIYNKFRENLSNDGLAYEGMLYREMVENIDNMQFMYDKYVFVGFNALNGVESKLFDHLNKMGKALFYWDYDKHYVDNTFNEAGHFMRANLERFPNALDKKMFNNMNSNNKDVTFVSADTDNIQTRYVSTWVKENISEKEIETAIVLCDETMLESVLHTLPEKVGEKKLEHLNVTMGFPISHTPVFSLVKQLVDLQTRGYDKNQNSYTLSAVENILKHPYIIRCSDNAVRLRNHLLNHKRFFPSNEELCCDEILTQVFTRYENNSEWIKNIAEVIYAIARKSTMPTDITTDLYEELFCEALLKAHCQLQRLLSLLEKGEVQMQQNALGNLLMRMLSGLSMPFHGEPVIGLQIMGLLETRNLDFKNIIVLAANEGNMPKHSNDNSFIPYNLRRAFGLTMSEHRDAIYAYYFYRLLQRAEKITVVYNGSTESKNKGECSRYLLQILGSRLYKNIKRIKLEAKQTDHERELKTIEKSPEVMEKLYSLFDTSNSDTAYPLSPSGINKFIDCGLKFFYYYILGLKKYEEVDTELKANEFGTIFHETADAMYKELATNCKGTITESDLEPYKKNPLLLYKLINDAFIKAFFKSGNKAVYNGKQLINRDVIYRLMQRLVTMDMGYAPLRYVGGEIKIRFPYTIDCNDRKININIGGTIDRVDAKGDTLNIIDYKTGGDDKESKNSLEDIFSHNGKDSGYRLQAFLYSIAIKKLIESGKDFTDDKDLSWIEKIKAMDIKKIVPTLLYIHKKANAKREDFIIKYGGAPIEDINEIADDYISFLDKTLHNIFDSKTPFEPTDKKERCVYCEYKSICGR